MSHTTARAALALAAITLLPLTATAQNAADIANIGRPPSQMLNLYIFPKNPKSDAEQLKDDTDCFNSARNQSSYDGKVASAESTPAPAQRTGGTVDGAVKGALAGTIIGAIAGNAGKGAAIGAGVGAVGGNSNQREGNRAARDNAIAQEEARKQAALADLKRAYSACMDAKGYSVK
ncbi:MAG: glycine zipper domain-containing protein [Proteobacteria bacterium]|nr:glycine zipper domain-containing protein [Pseudomonadota bacterium]